MVEGEAFSQINVSSTQRFRMNSFIWCLSIEKRLSGPNRTSCTGAYIVLWKQHFHGNRMSEHWLGSSIV